MEPIEIRGLKIWSLPLEIKVLDHMITACLLIGAMLPYWFSAMTMQSVGKAAMEMVDEVRR